MTRDEIDALVDERGIEGVLLADGFDEAFMGLGQQFHNHVAIYDRDKCIQILVDRDGMTEDEALEFFEFNVTGAYVGEQTPVFLELLHVDQTVVPGMTKSGLTKGTGHEG